MEKKIQWVKVAVIVTLLLNTLFLCAQKTTPDYTYNLGGKINMMQLTDAGVLVITNGDGLVGIKPGASAAHFDFKDYGKVKPEELEFVPMSPYLVVSQGNMFSSKKTVIDFVSGKKLFATEDNGWKFTNRCDVMLPQNKLVVLGQRKGGAMAVGLYDLVDGKEIKVIDLNDPKKVGSVASIPQFSGKPFIVGNGVLVPTTKNLMHIDIRNGNIDWTTKVDDISWLVADEKGVEIYAFEEMSNGDTKIYKVKNDGTILWPKGVKVKGTVTQFEILPQGLAIVSNVYNQGKSGLAKLASSASESKIAFLNAADGSDLWEKAPKTKGYVQHFYIMDDGILFGIQEGGINKIGFDGTTLFKKPLATGENIHTMALVPKGMIYITDTDANIINLKTGESIWSKPIKYKKAKAVCSTYDSKNKRYLISTGEEMLAIDEQSGDISTLSTYKFGEKEHPNSLQARDAGLVLTSDQNLMMLNFDGSQKFHEYHRSPGKSAAGAIFAGALGAASALAMTATAYTAGANQNSLGQYNDYGMQNKRASEMFDKIATASFAEMSKRFKATASTENSHIILTKLDDGVGLIKLNKDTGSKENEIVLKDKKPEYEVDEIGGFLYYRANDKTIHAFNLAK